METMETIEGSEEEVEDQEKIKVPDGINSFGLAWYLEHLETGDIVRISFGVMQVQVKVMKNLTPSKH